MMLDLPCRVVPENEAPAALEQRIRAEREAVIISAMSWLGTPFHDNVGIKGVGSDCAWFPYRIYRSVRLIPVFDIPEYSPQFLLHDHGRQRYLEVVERFAVQVPRDPVPGDFIMYWFGTCFSHGAIVTEWPQVAHARKPVGVTLDDALGLALLAELDRGTAKVLGKRPGDPRPRLVYTLKDWA